MTHQGELQKKKYRNWVRGGLAYKYLKEGIEGFADEVVQQDHNRILSVVSQTPGLACNQCCLRNLRPLHRPEKDPGTGRNKCPWRQSNCNCLYPKKHPCLNKVCDMILEDILKSHGSTPPTPNWKNTDIQKWCSTPWEIAKCFINAPGYSDKTKAADIDTTGLLHIFMNNINVQSHLSNKINWSDTFKKTLQRRNELFHSPTMEMEDTKLNECIDEIIAILEDEKELKVRNDAQQAVVKLKQLKQESFIITTQTEVEVCRDSLASITNKSEELKQTIQDAKDDIGKKQTEAKEAIGGSVKECRDAVASVTNKSVELKETIQEAKTEIGKEQAEAIEKIKDKTQKALQQIDKHSETLYERIGRLEIDSSFSKQRLTVLESKVDELDVVRQNHQRQLEYVERKQVFQKRLVELYQNQYVNTSISPLKLQENKINIKEVYVSPNMVVEEKPESIDNAPNKRNIITLTEYPELLQSNGQRHKHVFIVGDVGTGKSTFCKMMIQNWCSAVTADNLKDTRKSDGEHEIDNDHFSAVNDGNINEVRNYDFLFFVPLQRMSGLSDVTEMIKAILTNADIASINFIDRIFEQESDSCLIVADGLDEWTPPNVASVLQHVSHGLPNRDRAKNATLVTLSRRSAKGILNMRYSECDLKVELLGINVKSKVHFIDTYLLKFNKTGLSYRGFVEKIHSAKLDHLEKSPLLLKQLVWLYGTGNEVGKSISDAYSHLVNIMLGWSQNREEGDGIEKDDICDTKQDKDMNLPRLLRRFPKCDENQRFLLSLARVAFEAFTSETGATAFGRSHLRKRGVPKEAIDELIKFGIMIENTCFDPTLENTQMEFIHISYQEFLAAVYVSSHFNDQKSSILPNTILQDLFQKCKSSADVLELSNVLKMLCGLSPFLISKVSKLVSDIVREDESMISYRNSLRGYWYMYMYRYDDVSDQIQRLILNCLSECDSDDQQMVSLCTAIIDADSDMPLLQRIIPENVLFLRAVRVSNVEVWRWVTQLTRLQYMYIGYSRLPHREMVLLSVFIEEASLKYLSLYSVTCNSSNCHGHTIDLSKQDQLQKLELRYCSRVVIRNINTKHLEIVRFGYSNISNIDCLLNASSLTELDIRHAYRDYSGYNERVNSVMHTLQKLRKLGLYWIHIPESALNVTPEMRNLNHIKLVDVSMSLETWRRFVDSLLTLQQCVQVDTRGLYSSDDNRNYVRRNTIMFEVMKDDGYNFNFMTKK